MIFFFPPALSSFPLPAILDDYPLSATVCRINYLSIGRVYLLTRRRKETAIVRGRVARDIHVDAIFLATRSVRADRFNDDKPNTSIARNTAPHLSLRLNWPANLGGRDPRGPPPINYNNVENNYNLTLGRVESID